MSAVHVDMPRRNALDKWGGKFWLTFRSERTTTCAVGANSIAPFSPTISHLIYTPFTPRLKIQVITSISCEAELSTTVSDVQLAGTSTLRWTHCARRGVRVVGPTEPRAPR